MAGWQVGREHCLRHETSNTSRFGLFLLAISEIACTYQKKITTRSPAYINETKIPMSFFVKQVAMSPRQKTSTGGVASVRQAPLASGPGPGACLFLLHIL